MTFPITLLLATTALVGPPSSQMDPTARELLPNAAIVATLDVDGDGQEDLIGAGADGFLRTYEIDARGRLVQAKDLAPPVLPFTDAGTPSALVDVDGDGLLDLVGQRYSGANFDQNVVVWFDRGGELFEAPTVVASFDSQLGRREILADDFDGDGDVDLVAYPVDRWTPSATLPNRIEVTFNLGAGGFSPLTPVQSTSETVTAASPLDLDQDGDMDFVAIRSSGALVVLRNNAGSLQVEAVPTSLNAHWNLTTGDVNLDGVPDVVAFRRPNPQSPLDGAVDLYLGSVAGGLGSPVGILGGFPNASDGIALADVNGDGNQDLLLSEIRDDETAFNGVNVFAGSGTGTFSAAVRSSLTPGQPSQRPLVADINGDGRDDMISLVRVATPLSADYRTLIRLAKRGAPGSQLEFEDASTTNDSEYVGPILVADVDRDGLSDIVTAVEAEDTSTFLVPEVVWARGTAGSAQMEEARSIGVRGAPALAADFDVDGPSGVAILVRQTTLGGGLYLSQSTLSGAFQAPVLIGADDFYVNEPPVAVDWDQDGDLDLLGLNVGGNALVWMERSSAGTFAAASQLMAFGGSSAVNTQFVLGDFNADGERDVLFRYVNLGLFDNTSIFRPGMGGGTFGPDVELFVDAPEFFVGDYNGDGVEDVAWHATGTTRRIDWLAGGPVGFAPGAAQVLVSQVQDRGQIAHADYDGDFDLDILVLEQGSRDVYGYANLGGGAYSPTPVLVANSQQAPSQASREMVVTDLGGDGDLDILTGDGYWRENERNGIRGDSYCGPAVINSSGHPGRIQTLGSTAVAAETLRLRAVDLPRLAFGYFITSQTATAPMTATGSSGLICLGGAVGRYSAPSQIRFSGVSGQFSLAIDLSAMPTPTGLIQALPGSTWNFQAWFRDSSPTGATSNFTDAVSIDFQ